MTSRPISRRTFMVTAARAGALAGLYPLGRSGLSAQRSATTAKPWQIGCYTRVFDQFDYTVALDAIAEAGFATSAS